jgi:hypothetical protein
LFPAAPGCCRLTAGLALAIVWQHHARLSQRLLVVALALVVSLVERLAVLTADEREPETPAPQSMALVNQ